MHVWLITIGEPLPTDEGNPRLLRAGLIARTLAGQGHHVTWWSSTFDHQRKRLRADQLTSIAFDPRTRIVLLHGRPYAKNVSVDRLLNHRQLAKQFDAHAYREPRPDIVVASYPSIELCDSAVKFAARAAVPVVLDVRDLWPDIFLELAPSWARPAVRLALTPLFVQARRACRGAHAIFGITDAIRDWGIARAQRGRNRWDATFPLAYPQEAPDASSLLNAEAYWDRCGATRDRPIACFFGAFGRQIDFDCVIAAARASLSSNPSLLWVLCGDGDQWSRYRESTAALKNVLLPGWVGRPQIYALMQRAKVGLAPYRDLPDFRMSVPNKVVEYLSAGLPVVTTIGGVMREKLESHGAGTYVSAADPQALAAEVDALAGDKARHARFSDSARHLFQTDFNADAVHGKLIDHLSMIAHQYRRGISAAG